MWLRRSAALAAALFLVIFLPGVVFGASPEPSTGSGDTRSAGEAPGFIGAPLVAVASVLVLGTLAAGATIAYIRLTGGPGPAPAAAELNDVSPSRGS
jgi:hypothetical protein